MSIKQVVEYPCGCRVTKVIVERGWSESHLETCGKGEGKCTRFGPGARKHVPSFVHLSEVGTWPEGEPIPDPPPSGPGTEVIAWSTSIDLTPEEIAERDRIASEIRNRKDRP